MTNQNIATLPDEDLSNPKSASPDATLNASAEDAASATDEQAPMALKDRFRKFLPVVVDVETAGFNAQTDALLEIACIPVLLNEQGVFYPGEAFNAHIEPFEGANLEPSALAFTGIDPKNQCVKLLRKMKRQHCAASLKG